MKLKGIINERNTGNPRKRTTKKLISFTEITTMTAATTVLYTKRYQQGITYSRSGSGVDRRRGRLFLFSIEDVLFACSIVSGARNRGRRLYRHLITKKTPNSTNFLQYCYLASKVYLCHCHQAGVKDTKDC